MPSFKGKDFEVSNTNEREESQEQPSRLDLGTSQASFEIWSALREISVGGCCIGYAHPSPEERQLVLRTIDDTLFKLGLLKANS